MDTVSIHVTMQQQKETPLVEIVSEDEDLTPIHELTHDSDCHEHSMELNNPMRTHVKESAHRSSPFQSEPNPSCTCDYSLGLMNKSLN